MSSTTTITEGSATMTYPASQDGTVFYNPVQVQNRDLSVLMITLYAERRAMRLAIQDKKKELNKQLPPTRSKKRKHYDDKQQAEKVDETETNGKIYKTKEEIAKEMEEFKVSLDGTKLVAEHVKQHKPQSPQEDDGDKMSPPLLLSVLDALAASGLRSIRYWKEIPGIGHLTINDLEAAAVERAKSNLRDNNLQNVVVDDEKKQQHRPYGICVQQGDAQHVMYTSRRPPTMRMDHPDPLLLNRLDCQFSVIDLDPYGSAAPFVDSAVQALDNSGGLLCCTCTDMAALGGSHPETAFGRYGGSMPLQRAGYLQEAAVRILLHKLATASAVYGKTIRPILSVGMDFYIRVFVEIANDKKGVQDLSLNTGYAYQSTQCPSFYISKSGQMGGKKGTVYQAGRAPGQCTETQAALKVGGPMWLGPLHDADVIATALKRLENVESNPNLQYLATKDRLRGLLASCREELPDCPLYYKLSDLASTLGVTSPSLLAVQSALVNAGYRVSGYHKEPTAVKTDAPSQVVWDVMRTWYQEHKSKKEPTGAAAKIVAVEPTIKVDFTTPGSLQKRHREKNEGVSRFPMNPQANWGPKRKASGKTE